MKSWFYDKGVYAGKSVIYENGRVIQEDYFDKETERYYSYITTPQGKRLVLYDDVLNAPQIICDYKENTCICEGYGFKLNSETQEPIVAGFFHDDCLIKVTQEFISPTTMIEFDNEDFSVPIYSGGYAFKPSLFQFVRDGKGCIVNSEGIAIEETEYSIGELIERGRLDHGWNRMITDNTRYPEEDRTVIWSENDFLEKISNTSIRSLKISATCCNNKEVNFSINHLHYLQHLVISSESMSKVRRFCLDGLNALEDIIIGENSFTQFKNTYRKGTGVFSVMNCDVLSSIRIGRNSFSDYSEFSLNSWMINFMMILDLPNLLSLKIGEFDDTSYNFAYATVRITSLS